MGLSNTSDDIRYFIEKEKHFLADYSEFRIIQDYEC